MATMFDYIRWRGDLTFTQDPPNAVDALIFSSLSYIRYGAMVESQPQSPVLLRDAAEYFFALEDTESRVRVEHDLDLLHQAASSSRFGQAGMEMCRDTLVSE